MATQTRIAVAGATGRVGRHIARILWDRGHEVVAISRSAGVDVVTGAGLDEALRGVGLVIDASTGASPDQAEETAFFTASARNLQAAAERAGARRMIVLSIIGIDDFTGGYNAAKKVHEREVLAGPVPVQIVRAAQFHELVEAMVGWGTQGDVTHVPRMRTQPAAAAAVAEVVADLVADDDPASAGPGAPVVEVAGPREESMVALAERFVAARGLPLRVEGVGDPSDHDSALYQEGAVLPSPGAVLVGPTFDEWLAAGA
ncbi:MAG: SDR family oxidoreductase [Thermoleophilia bacterium]